MPQRETEHETLLRLLYAPDDAEAIRRVGVLNQLATLAVSIRDAPADRRDAFDSALGALVTVVAKAPWVAGRQLPQWQGEPGLAELRAVLAAARALVDPAASGEEFGVALVELRAAVRAADRVQFIGGIEAG